MRIFDKLKKLFLDCVKDSHAVSVIEFAFIGPLLVVIYIGSIESYVFLRGRAETSKASATLSECLASLTDATDRNVLHCVGAARLNFLRTDPDSSTFVAFSSQYHSIDKVEGIWIIIYGTSYGLVDVNKNGYWSAGQLYDSPTGYLSPGQTALVGSATQTVYNPIGLIFPGSIPFTIQTYGRPRRTLLDNTGTVNDGGIVRQYKDCGSIDANGPKYSFYSKDSQGNQIEINPPHTTFTNLDLGC